MLFSGTVPVIGGLYFPFGPPAGNMEFMSTQASTMNLITLGQRIELGVAPVSAESTDYKLGYFYDQVYDYILFLAYLHT